MLTYNTNSKTGPVCGGRATSEIKTYTIDENEWQFADSSTLQIFRNQ